MKLALKHVFNIRSLLKYSNFEITDSLLILFELIFIFIGIWIILITIFVIINFIAEILDLNKFFKVNINKNNPSAIFIKNLIEKIFINGFYSLIWLSILYMLVSFLLLTSHFIISVNILKNEFFKFDLILFTIELTNFQLKFLFNTVLIIIAYFKYKSIIELLRPLIEILTGKATPQ